MATKFSAIFASYSVLFAPTSSIHHHTAKMTIMTWALSLLVLFSQVLHAAQAEPASVNTNSSAVNSDDSFRHTTIEPNPSSENEKENNTYSDTSREREDNLFPPGISLSGCEGFFEFSAKIPQFSGNISSLFPNYNNKGDLNTRVDYIHCNTKPDDEKEGELKVSCRCRNKSTLRMVNDVLACIGGVVIVVVSVVKLCQCLGCSPCKRKAKDGREIGYQSVAPQPGSEMDRAIDETVVDEEIGKEFDDSNYPMG